MLFLLVLTLNIASGDEKDTKEFGERVQPFVQQYCSSCHNETEREGDLDLTADRNVPAILRNFRHWMVVLERLDAGDMPPEGAKKPPAEERASVIAWLERVRDAEAERTSGDPGVVLARRLSNAEYDRTIRDLTGVDIRPAYEFPVDPANEAGFDNSGESLTMSPALLKKYLTAARSVADHLVLTPTGLTFAPHPVITDTDRDKFCVNRIINFYNRQRTDYADYFLLLWRHRVSLKTSEVNQSLAERARESGLSVKYSQTLDSLLRGDRETVGPIAVLQIMFSSLPNANSQETEAIAGCRRMAQFVLRLRESLIAEVPNLTAPGVHNGSQPLVLWKNRQFVAARRRYSGKAVPPDLGLASDSPAARAMDDADTRKMKAALDRFCDVFPDAFFVSERARVYLDPKKEMKLKGRYLSAGFHSQMGYFRDDAPLYDLMLDDFEQQEIDRLWLELDFVTSAPMRQYAGFIWFDRTDSGFLRDREFDRYRAEDKDCSSDEKVRGLANAYIGKAERLGAGETALQALRDYFANMSATFRRLEALRSESQALHVSALVNFTERAFRRQLSDGEREDVREFYNHLRRVDGLSHEDAVRDCLVRTLMSPHFCYRVDLTSAQASRIGDAIPDVQPLDDFALASRLSYFLWSSMPDEELIGLAKEGRLQDPDVLVAQTHRMLCDKRARALATEFAGNWLDFRRFEQHNGVDRGRFPEYNDGLRRAMFEEPIQFLLDIILNDGSVLDCLYADHTFVNAELAEHYRIAVGERGMDGGWWRVDDAKRYGRGGLLPMAVFLTYNSPGLRTSPVKRGNWVVKRIFGENVPAPPTAVPDLPEDESQLGELTLREVLARHRADRSCAVCHERIDSFGLAFEGYGPVGEVRTNDLGGRQIDATATFPDQSTGRGLAGLQRYIRAERQDDFLDNLCRKLLAYGLGRTLQLSDEATVRQMRAALEENDFRFRSMIETIVNSPAFLNKRVELELQ